MKATTRLAIATHAILAIYFVSTAVIVTTLSSDDAVSYTHLTLPTIYSV